MAGPEVVSFHRVPTSYGILHHELDDQFEGPGRARLILLPRQQNKTRDSSLTWLSKKIQIKKKHMIRSAVDRFQYKMP